MPAGSNTWIFQGNPEIWDVSGGLAQLRHWAVRQHKDHILTGDRFFIWESGKQAGIVAKATVTKGPAFLEDTSEEVTLYRNFTSAFGC